MLVFVRVAFKEKGVVSEWQARRGRGKRVASQAGAWQAVSECGG